MVNAAAREAQLNARCKETQRAWEDHRHGHPQMKKLTNDDRNRAARERQAWLRDNLFRKDR